jgi:hypothetical protein
MSGDGTERELLEELAALEHRQWIHWTQGLKQREDLPEHLTARWAKNWKPYDELDEETKEHDRKWARKVLDILDDRSVDTETSHEEGSR